MYLEWLQLISAANWAPEFGAEPQHSQHLASSPLIQPSDLGIATVDANSIGRSKQHTMSALQHPTLARPPRCLQLPCRAEQASPAGSTHNAPSSSRRTALGAALLLPAGAVLAAARPAVADELAVASAAEAEAVVVPPVLDVISWPQWVDRNFSFSYPPGFKEVQDLSYAAPPRPRAGTGKQVACLGWAGRADWLAMPAGTAARHAEQSAICCLGGALRKDVPVGAFHLPPAEWRNGTPPC